MLVFAALVIALAFAAYIGLIRPYQLRWGATDEEVLRAMPGDEVVARPHFVATRAVTVQARPAEIWPWLVQMGATRAGFYSYDWLDNAGQPSAERILTELQELKIGDFVPMTPDRKNGMWVKEFTPDTCLLWWDQKGAASWLWQLTPLDAQHTRLLTRLRTRYKWSLPWVIYYLVYDFGDIVMMRKCLLGIKHRAEALHQPA